MNIDQIIQNFNSQAFYSLVIKAFGIISAFLYLCFALVVMKQVQVMKKTIEIKDRGLLSLAAFIQLILAILLLLYSLFIL